MVFTMGQVARLLGVRPTTVANWHEDGHLKGYKIPGSNQRRFPREDVQRFLRQSGFDDLDELQKRVQYRVSVFGMDDADFKELSSLAGSIALMGSDTVNRLREHIEGGFNDCVVISEDHKDWRDAAGVANEQQVATVGLTMRSGADEYTSITMPTNLSTIVHLITSIVKA